MYEWDGCYFGEFSHIWAPPMGIFFELQQHNVPQKITFSMKMYDYENEIIV